MITLSKLQREIGQLEDELALAKATRGTVKPGDQLKYPEASKWFTDCLRRRADFLEERHKELITQRDESRRNFETLTKAAFDSAAVMATENAGLRRDLKRVEDSYTELLMAVVRSFPNETRHQTALRYIKEAEEGVDKEGPQQEGSA
jgi:hypothetical protein